MSALKHCPGCSFPCPQAADEGHAGGSGSSSGSEEEAIDRQRGERGEPPLHWQGWQPGCSWIQHRAWLQAYLNQRMSAAVRAAWHTEPKNAAKSAVLRGMYSLLGLQTEQAKRSLRSAITNHVFK